MMTGFLIPYDDKNGADEGKDSNKAFRNSIIIRGCDLGKLDQWPELKKVLNRMLHMRSDAR